jgi:hypothetical protein
VVVRNERCPVDIPELGFDGRLELDVEAAPLGWFA